VPHAIFTHWQGLPSSRAVIENMMSIVDRSGSGCIDFEQVTPLDTI
jgi:hypothetical protein